MWLEITYKPTTLFSLKVSSATNSAGKSLPCPSPYSVKMALLNAVITYDSLETAKRNFNLIRDLEMFFKITDAFVVNNCLIRIMKDNDKVKPRIKKTQPFKKTVAFREYVYFKDELNIAVKIDQDWDNKEIEFLKKWFMHINYFGKKGCFFQFVSVKQIDELSDDYSKALGQDFPAGIMFPMDDVVKDNSVLFKNMDNYDTAKAKRKQQIHIFPFRQVAANKNFAYFRKLEKS